MILSYGKSDYWVRTKEPRLMMNITPNLQRGLTMGERLHRMNTYRLKPFQLERLKFIAMELVTRKPNRGKSIGLMLLILLVPPHSDYPPLLLKKVEIIYAGNTSEEGFVEARKVAGSILWELIYRKLAKGLINPEASWDLGEKPRETDGSVSVWRAQER